MTWKEMCEIPEDKITILPPEPNPVRGNYVKANGTGKYRKYTPKDHDMSYGGGRVFPVVVRK